jgi:type II secretory ATPase GspE/PulE/Tfp pilus assembly ATPase PilB-like protein
MADVADASYEQFAYQGARISNGLPEGLQAVRLQFNPVGFDGRQLIIRLLYSKQSAGSSLPELGFDKGHMEYLDYVSKISVGCFIVCGPTGSGKSTTLERMLSGMVKSHPGDHFLSVEDPPEYLIPGVVQLPVSNARTDEERAEAFSEAIAASLRSDPDKIMIGEIRTKASAQLALRAALTGHAVFTTLHSNDAMGILTRLKDIGIEDYMLKDSSLIKGMLAQRLVRKLCPHCRKPATLGDLPNGLDRRLQALERVGEVYVQGPGCDHCRDGFQGRTVVAEIIMPDEQLLDLIVSGRRIEAFQYWKEKLGGRTLLDHAVDKIFQGVLDPREVEHKVGRIE